MKHVKGFTIIELLVVIVIIAVLTAITIPYVSAYKNKAKNAAMEASLDTFSSKASLFYIAYGYYGLGSGPASTICAGGNINNAPSPGVVLPSISAISPDGVVTCKVSFEYTSWCACVKMYQTSKSPYGSFYCVDSSGIKKEYTTISSTDPPITCATGCAAGMQVDSSGSVIPGTSFASCQ
jgi:prepilin-type N-terminal cleavage/methylation domain-containing protein